MFQVQLMSCQVLADNEASKGVIARASMSAIVALGHDGRSRI